MKNQISRGLKRGFFHCWWGTSFVLLMFVMPLLGIYNDMYVRNLHLVDLIWGLIGAGVLGALLAVPLTRLFSRRIEPGKYVLGAGEGEGKTVEIAVPTWVTREYHDQLLHVWRGRMEVVALFFLGTVVFMVVFSAWGLVFAFAENHQGARWSAHSNILNAPLSGHLRSISPVVSSVSTSADKVEIELDNRLWLAPTGHVLVTYDEGMQELFNCAQRVNQPPEHIIGWSQPKIKLEKLGRVMAASGDDREVVKISWVKE